MPTISSLASRWVERFMTESPAELFLNFDGFYTRVDSNSRELIDKLAAYFREFVCDAVKAPHAVITAVEAPEPDVDYLEDQDLTFTIKQPDPGKTKIKEEWCDLEDGRAVRKRLTGMLFLFGGGENRKNLAIGPCIENDNQVVNFINNRFIEWTLNQGCLLFHAAGVARQGDGLALAGFSGMGKSTLALHIMCRGTDFVSNDRLMVHHEDSRLTMYGVAKMPRINPGTILHNSSLAHILSPEERAEFEKLSGEDLWSLEHKYDGFIDECFGPGRFKLSASMKALVLLNWKHDGSPMLPRRIDLREREELMPAFMKSVGLFYDPMTHPEGAPDFSRQAYLELLADCPVYELSGGVDFEKAAEYCDELLK